MPNSLKLLGSPNGTRTRVAGVRGRYPRPLDDGTGWLGDEDSNLIPIFLLLKNSRHCKNKIYHVHIMCTG